MSSKPASQAVGMTEGSLRNLSNSQSQKSWSYNSIFETDRESFSPGEPLFNAAKNNEMAISCDNDQTQFSGPASFTVLGLKKNEAVDFPVNECDLDIVVDSQESNQNDSVDFLATSPTENAASNFDTQLSPLPSRKVTGDCNLFVKETQGASFEPDIIDSNSTNGPDSLSFLAESSNTPVKDNLPIENDEELCETQLSPSVSESIPVLGTKRQTEPSAESSPAKIRKTENDSQNTSKVNHSDEDSGQSTPENVGETSCDYDALFESQSKQESVVESSPERDEDLSFLQTRSPSPDNAPLVDCPSPVFVVPTEVNIVSRIKEHRESAETQTWTLTQQTQEMEPLSLVLPDTQEFEGRFRCLTKESEDVDLTQMTQEMAPLSLQLPNTQEFEKRLGIVTGRSQCNDDLDKPHAEAFASEELTQMTQGVEPLSLQLPDTQTFQRQLDAKRNMQNDNVGSEMCTQLTQDLEPLTLKLPSAQDFNQQISTIRETLSPEIITPQTNESDKKVELDENKKSDADNKIQQSDKSGKSTRGTLPQPPRVAFSNNSNNLKATVEQLGGTVNEIEEATVFVCDLYRMTWKMQAALEKKILVVTSKWLMDSAKAQSFQCPELYKLQDKRKRK